MLELLEKFTAGFGPAGEEMIITELIKDEITGYCDEIKTDKLGNLIAYKKGKGNKKIMLAAHMDEIGIMITHIDEEGFLRFTPIGGVNPRILRHQKMVFVDGTLGTIGVEKLDDIKDLKLEKLFLDIGQDSKDKVEKQISIGDTAVYQKNYYHTGDRIIANSLDDRAGCALLAGLLQEIKEPAHDLYFVFTSQEEVGTRGATTAAFGISPDLALAVDVTDTGDTPEARTMDVKLGAGAAIKIMDRGSISHPGIRKTLEELAQKNDISYQHEVLEFGATDARAIQLSKEGVPSGTLSIPCRYIHSPAEMIDVNDYKSCAQLLERFVTSELLDEI